MRRCLLLGICALLLCACTGRNGLLQKENALPAMPESPPEVQVQPEPKPQIQPEPAPESESEPAPESEPASGEDWLAGLSPEAGRTAEQKIEWQFTPADDPVAAYAEAEIPMLVNTEHRLPEGFDADAYWVEQLPYPYGRKGMTALLDMISAAKKEGITLTLISGYRSVESQARNFANNKKELMAQGYSDAEAEAETARYFAYPGASEHNLGLAADLNSLEDSFENTAEFGWLSKNAWKYGFVLRYPKDKVEITGIAYEPWHYRYVGSSHAKAMVEGGLCLEEYWTLLQG